jgi:hypothetical protein
LKDIIYREKEKDECLEKDLASIDVTFFFKTTLAYVIASSLSPFFCLQQLSGHLHNVTFPVEKDPPN